MREAELIRLNTIYSYPMIGVYCFFLDFVSPLSDEVLMVAIAYLSKTGMVNKFGVALVSFTVLYGRNILYFLLGGFYGKAQVILNKMNSQQTIIVLIFILIFSGIITYNTGRHFLNKDK
jgi:membrane protein DedA with SNARE-associated domain